MWSTHFVRVMFIFNVGKTSGRSSHKGCYMEKGVLRNFTKFKGKQACDFIKKRLWHRYFPVNFAKFLRTSFLQNTSERLLLNVIPLSYLME